MTASRNGKNGGITLTKEKRLHIDRLVVGGLHKDDFEWVAQRYEGIGYILVAFVLDRDGYHWKAVYVKADQLEKEGSRHIQILTGVDANVENVHNLV